MGTHLQSLKSNLQKQSHSPQPTTWVFHAIHGTNVERLVVANHKCTKKENSKWEDQLVTPRLLPNVCIWLEPWVVTKNSALSVSITEILAGLVKVSLKPPELSMLFTTLQVTNWSVPKLW